MKRTVDEVLAGAVRRAEIEREKAAARLDAAVEKLADAHRVKASAEAGVREAQDALDRARAAQDAYQPKPVVAEAGDG